MHSYFSGLSWLGTALWASVIHIIPLLFIPIARRSGVELSVYLHWFIVGALLSLILSHAGYGIIPTRINNYAKVITAPPTALLVGTVLLGTVIGGSYLLLLMQSAEKALAVGANPALPFIIMTAGVIGAYLILGIWYGISIKFLIGTALILAGGYLIKSSLHF